MTHDETDEQCRVEIEQAIRAPDWDWPTNGPGPKAESLYCASDRQRWLRVRDDSFWPVAFWVVVGIVAVLVFYILFVAGAGQ